MATRTVTTVTIAERKSELEALIAQSQTAQRKAEGELAKLEQALNASAVELGELRLRHVEHCRRHAQGAKSDHVQVAADINSTEARRVGLQSLIEEKQGEIVRIRNARDPLEAEVAQIHRQEFVDRESLVIEQLYEEALSELARRDEIAKSFDARLEKLRGYEDGALKPRAYQHAEALQRLWHGMRP